MSWFEDEKSPYSQYVMAIEALDEEYKAKRAAIKAKLRDAQQKCTHSKTTYYPDPSGNNDSYWQCDLCGLRF